jgi:hypothetical protein
VHWIASVVKKRNREEKIVNLGVGRGGLVRKWDGPCIDKGGAACKGLKKGPQNIHVSHKN